MKRLLLLGSVLAVALLAPGVAQAHPLGNFTVNRYAGIELSGGRLYVRYALDLAEIPAFQEGDSVRAPGYARRVAARLSVTLDGSRVALTPVRQRVTELPGAGGLETLRFDAIYAGVGSGSRLRVRDTNFAERIGWRELTISARDGARVLASSVPAASASDALRSYPDDLLRSPLDVRTADATIRLGRERAFRPPSTGPPHRCTAAAASRP